MAVRGNPDYPVNRGYLCVKGIYQFRALEARDRLRAPMIRKGEIWKRVSWDQALDLVASKIKEAVAAGGPHVVGFYGTGQAILEDYYCLAKLAFGAIGTANLDGNIRLCMSSAAEGHKLTYGSDGPPGNLDDVEETGCILLFGCNPANMHPILFYRMRRAKLICGTKVIVIDPRITPSSILADIQLRPRICTDLALLNAMANVLIRDGLVDHDFIRRHTNGFDEFRETVRPYTPEAAQEICGVPAREIERAARIYGEARRAFSLWMSGANQRHTGTALNRMLHSLALITGNAGRAGANTLSLAGQCSSMSGKETGAYGNLPGYRDFQRPEDREELAKLWGVPPERIPRRERPFQALEQVASGQIKLLWVIGSNPAVSYPDANFARQVLGAAPFLIVSEAFHPTETSRYAHLVLPAAIWGEKTGLFTNSERRVNLCRQAVSPPGEARPDWWIFGQVAARLGHGALFPFRDSEAIFEEWKQVSRRTPVDMSGMSYEKIESRQGIRWPCNRIHPEGTERLYSDLNFPSRDGRAELAAFEHEEPEEKTGPEYPFRLNPGRVLQQWMTRTRSAKIAELEAEVPRPFVDLNPSDASRLRIKDGEQVRLVSRRGQALFWAHLTDRMHPGELFVPFHFGEQTANFLTPNIVDPISKQPAFKGSAAVRVEKL